MIYSFTTDGGALAATLFDLSFFHLLTLFITIILVILIYIFFLNDGNKNKFSGSTKKIFDFLTLRSFYFQKIIRISYLSCMIYFTLYGSLFLFINPFISFIYIIVYNLVLRLVFELLLAVFKVKSNTDKLVKMDNTTEQSMDNTMEQNVVEKILDNEDVKKQ